MKKTIKVLWLLCFMSVLVPLMFNSCGKKESEKVTEKKAEKAVKDSDDFDGTWVISGAKDASNCLIIKGSKVTEVLTEERSVDWFSGYLTRYSLTPTVEGKFDSSDVFFLADAVYEVEKVSTNCLKGSEVGGIDEYVFKKYSDSTKIPEITAPTPTPIPTDTPTPEPLSEQMFSVKVNEITLFPGMQVDSETLMAIGAYNSIDYGGGWVSYYYFGDSIVTAAFDLIVNPDHRISSIDIFGNDYVEQYTGIKIGANISEVISKFGAPDYEDIGVIRYNINTIGLSIYYDETVKSIAFLDCTPIE